MLALVCAAAVVVERREYVVAVVVEPSSVGPASVVASFAVAEYWELFGWVAAVAVYTVVVVDRIVVVDATHLRRQMRWQ